MKLQRSLLVFSFGIGSALAVNACGSDDEPGPSSNTGGAMGSGAAGGAVGNGGGGSGAGGGPSSGGTTATGGGTASGGTTATGGGTASGGSANPNACSLDFATLPANAPVSLKDDLMPIFGLSCNGNDCHSAPTKKAGLYLGPKCDFDETAKFSCKFPAAPNPDTGSAPVTQQVIDEVHASLLDNAKTVTTNTVKRVVPGNPGASFVIDKTSDKQNTKGYQCTNTDPKPGEANTCGGVMPLNNDPLCRSGRTGAEKYTKLAQWIKNGAPKN